MAMDKEEVDKYVAELLINDHPYTAGPDKAVTMDRLADRDAVTIFGKLCATQREMADFFCVSQRTIEKYMADKEGEFYKIYSRGSAEAKTSLRRMQINKAMGGDNTLLIWLGKQLLDQKDKIEEKVDTTMRTLIIDSDDANL